MKTKQYTSAERIKVLKKLQLNDCSYEKTARENKVSVPTIKRWCNEFPEIMVQADKVKKQRVQSFEKSVKEECETFFKELAEINKLAVERAKILVKQETDFAKIIKFFELYKSVHTVDSETGDTVFNLFNQLNQQFITNQT